MTDYIKINGQRVRVESAEPKEMTHAEFGEALASLRHAKGDDINAIAFALCRHNAALVKKLAAPPASRLAEAEGLLREVEWQHRGSNGYYWRDCPLCAGFPPGDHKIDEGDHIGHKLDCRLAAFLAAETKP